MSKTIDSIYTLYNNVFRFTDMIYAFYKNYKGNEKDILLAYLVLPLVLETKSQQSLLHCNTKSSLFTFCRNKENYCGLQSRVTEYKEITNDCIQYGIDMNLFSLSDDMKLEIINDKELLMSDEIKAASNLYKIFKEYNIQTIYKKLGVVKL